MPAKGSLENLGDTRKIALKRFHSLENKFKLDKAFHKKYSEFIDEYLALKHMRLINENKDVDNDNIKVNYLPHHAVIKSDNLTTQLRVVFDASAKSESGLALNDILTVGPTIQQDLFSIIIRFRTYNFVLTADISKMYRQIIVNKSQTALQRILWRSNPSEPIKTDELSTVTYGYRSSTLLDN